MRGIAASKLAWCAVAIAAVFAVRAASVRAERARSMTFAVHVVPAGAAAWRADALAAALAADLADDRLRAPAAGARAELVVRGELAERALRYAIERPGRLPLRGAIALRGLDRAQLAGALRDVLHRIVEPPETAVAAGGPAELAAPGALGPALGLVAALAALLVAPLALGLALVGRRVWRTRAIRRVAPALVGLAGVGYALVEHGGRAPELAGPLLLAGGLAWGALAAVVLPVALPPLPGLHRVEHGELLPVLRAWAALALQRTLAVALIALPLGLAVGAAGDAIGAPRLVSFAVIAPIAALAAGLAWRALVELLALRLDGELVDGDPGEAQPWHPHVRAYLIGYLRRANLSMDLDLLELRSSEDQDGKARAKLEGVRFLPGRADEVAVYGGGLAHTRVVIGRAMLELALAPYGRPHDYPMPRVSTLHWMEWSSGLVMPSEPGDKPATREDRRPHVTVDEGVHERIALGEPPTLTGVIEPAAFDPRTGYRPGEDPLWLDWDPGEDYDGTDASDKDFLFGVVVHALGAVHRREDRAATLALAWRRWLAGGRLARLAARITGPVRRSAARRASALADVHAALAGARHHLAQYLAWRLWRREDLLTARAYVPVLEQSSRAIAAALDADRAGDPALRGRLARLRRFVTAGAGGPPRRRLALAFAVLAGVGVAAALAIQAALYHPDYEERMQRERRIEDGKPH